MSSPSSAPGSDVTLSPRYWVPLGVAALALPPLLLLPLLPQARGPLLLLALVLLLFGLFLAVQASLLRLRFGPDALQVLRRDSEIRRFPYDQWLNWRIFWFPLPVLFYFRETRSPHLLPMLFDATALRSELQQRLSADPLPHR